MPIELDTMAQAYRIIQTQESVSPWVPLGNFMNHFFGPLKVYRQLLIDEPLPIHDVTDERQHRWATFCAASALFLSASYHLIVPEWAEDERYMLAHPWYMTMASNDSLDRRMELQHLSPKPFADRLIYCDPDIYANKYELLAAYPKRSKAKQSA